MAVSAGDITNYLSYIKYAQSTYMDSLNLKERLGHNDLLIYRLRNVILGHYVTIMVDYFAQTDYENNNFFTTDEALEVMQRINRLCDSNYNLDI